MKIKATLRPGGFGIWSKGIFKRSWLALVGLAQAAAAYDNSSMNEDFQKFVAGDINGMVHTSYTAAWGGWWYLILVLAPYLALFMYQQSLTVASIWLVSMLVAYRYLLAGVPDYITYLCVVVWVFSAVYRVGSPVRPE